MALKKEDTKPEAIVEANGLNSSEDAESFRRENRDYVAKAAKNGSQDEKQNRVVIESDFIGSIINNIPKRPPINLDFMQGSDSSDLKFFFFLTEKGLEPLEVERMLLAEEKLRVLRKEFEQQQAMQPAVEQVAQRPQTEATLPPPLPSKALALWNNPGARQPGETPPAFIVRQYGPCPENGLDRPKLRHLDAPLYKALTNWERTHEAPEGFHLPSKSELVAAEQEQTSPEKVREAMKIVGRWSRQTADRQKHGNER